MGIHLPVAGLTKTLAVEANFFGSKLGTLGVIRRSAETHRAGSAMRVIRTVRHLV
jgi:hypothetical protein